jgi:hypothetical protein
MRVLSKGGSYLRNQAWKNLALAALCLLIMAAALTPFIIEIPNLLRLQIGLLEEIQLAVTLVALIGFGVFAWRYKIFHAGSEGEHQVTKLLKAKLNDDYFLINGAHFRGGGDIDHIVLAPNGLFVVETKNWSGKIACHGDTWQRERGKPSASSPSKQAKRNATRVRNIVEASSVLAHGGVWVEGVVVFTNRHANLDLSSPSVPVVRLQELPSFIASYSRSGSYSRHQLEQIGKEILKQKR